MSGDLWGGWFDVGAHGSLEATGGEVTREEGAEEGEAQGSACFGVLESARVGAAGSPQGSWKMNC